jgi:hypothetical protein
MRKKNTECSKKHVMFEDEGAKFVRMTQLESMACV